jgi:hypothetical protein
MKTIIIAAAAASMAFSASAAPLLTQATPPVEPLLIQQVKIVCEPNGVCFRPPGRPLVARWVYGDDAFYGPYVGPGNYGRPGSHYGWSVFGYWW